MIDPAIVTAAEMEKLSSNERAAVVRERMVTDLDTADPELVAWAREQFMPVPEDWWDSFEPPPGTRAEIIRGVLSLSPSPRPIHGLVQFKLIALLMEAMPEDCVVVPCVEWKFAARGIVAMAPQFDVMVCRWRGEGQAFDVVMPPVLGVEVLSPSDIAADRRPLRDDLQVVRQAVSRVVNPLALDAGRALPGRYELRDGLMIAVERVVGDQVLTATEPFGYTLQPSALVKP